MREALRSGKPAEVLAGDGATLPFFTGRRWAPCAFGDVAAFRWVAEAARPEADDAEPHRTALHRIFVVPDGEPVHALLTPSAFPRPQRPSAAAGGLPRGLLLRALLRGTGVIETILKCGVRWEERDPERLLARPEISALETYQELVRTPKMHAQLISLTPHAPTVELRAPAD